MMSMCGYEQSAPAGCEGMDSVVRPKPRRFSLLNPSFNDNIIPFRYFNHKQSEIGDSEAGSEILDIILAKVSVEQSIKPCNPRWAFRQHRHYGSIFAGTAYVVIAKRRLCSDEVQGQAVAVRIEGFDCLSSC